ncbi:hypothetical protein N0V94_005139 [Neodidymelliopsis sp. IMI 364377]|nr:hypothetical protein N0V94_005139 [Neodidymelliopsis sp. IMI 364377]
MSLHPYSFHTPATFPSRQQDNSRRGTYHIIRSAPFTEQDWASATDTDAPADEWDEAEYERQMYEHLTQVYAGKMIMELRRLCKNSGLRARGNKDELIDRLAAHDVRVMYGAGAGN